VAGRRSPRAQALLVLLVGRQVADASIFATRPDPNLLSPWAGLGVMAGSTAALLASAFAAFRKRDV
jgi:hypothetical protein